MAHLGHHKHVLQYCITAIKRPGRLLKFYFPSESQPVDIEDLRSFHEFLCSLIFFFLLQNSWKRGTI